MDQRQHSVSPEDAKRNKERATLCAAMGWSLPHHAGSADHLIEAVGYTHALAYAHLGVRYIYQHQVLHDLGIDPADLAALRSVGTVVDDYINGRVSADHLTMALTTLYITGE